MIKIKAINQATTKLFKQVTQDMMEHSEANNILKFNLNNKFLNRSQEITYSEFIKLMVH